MYKVQITFLKDGMWEYHIVFDKNEIQHSIGRGYRSTEQAARIDGVADMKLARSFGVGLNEIYSG